LDNEQLKTKVIAADEDSVLTVIKEGVLLCKNCKVWYPISSYVPIMLAFKGEFHERFAARHQARLTKIAGYSFPKWEAEPGERDVQKTFTEEWNTLQYDDLCWTFTKDELRLVHQKAFLKWPEKPPRNVQNILNVGIGFGAEAEALHDISGAEVFGVDLNFALLHSGALFLKKPFMHLIVASLFHLPFEPNSFDLVYSVGVLHHTYSTYDALKSVSTFVKEGGQIFIWVYALEDILYKRGLSGILTKLSYMTQVISRPVLSRSPSWLRHGAIATLPVILHPIFLMRTPHKKIWKLKNTNHNLRDSFTPRYYRYHSFNEVLEWLESLGFSCELPSPRTFRRLVGRRLDGVGLLGTKGILPARDLLAEGDDSVPLRGVTQ